MFELHGLDEIVRTLPHIKKVSRWLSNNNKQLKIELISGDLMREQNNLAVLTKCHHLQMLRPHK